MSDKLFMTFEANTIKHLGVKMYSNMPPALAELIANAYDACATEVHVRLLKLRFHFFFFSVLIVIP